MTTDYGEPDLKRLAVLGSTGSIGVSTLHVARELGKNVQILGLSANRNLKRLVEQAQEFRPEWIVATDEASASKFAWPALPGTELLIGHQQLNRMVQAPEVDTVVAAIVGIAGLHSTLAAIQQGKTVALANKETLVAAGPVVMKLAEETGANILPVDSEHNAIFQCLRAGARSEVARVCLTASGGPFREFTQQQMENVVPKQALAHPTWDMGQKISIDSATMMNKALEIIEAKWLFGLSADQIEVVVHPQSIVHSMVEFVDGSVIAQMSPPDMKLPIQYALVWPHRIPGPAPRLRFQDAMSLDFQPPDIGRFPAVALGLQVARQGGTSGAVLNAANEAAVDAFLKKRIGFCDIVRACQDVLQQHAFQPHPTINEIVAIDQWAREEIDKWI
ncbi:MAG: 1-deoxy-D-xylulose-5-phosphate reductoisomerase [Planctomycetaceae bacterium]|nr:1-deoxy-D-xylulose-5-phosphate reductoisomerase [Planctomycetaceae bacterium]